MTLRTTFLVTLFLGLLTAFAQTTKPFTIPELQTWQAKEGQFVPSSNPRTIYIEGGAEAKRVAQAFIQDYKMLLGKDINFQILKKKPQSGAFILSLNKDKSLSKESYRLNVGENAEVSATTPKALYWGTRTLLQLSEQAQAKNYALPRGTTMDSPLYAVRGLLLDCGRKFFPMSYLRDLVKVMAYYKMNTLQVHLNDNGFKQFFGNDWNKTQSAFRLESERFPGLTAKDGHYTKAEFRAFQLYADSLGVEIIPEIDVPAHSLAFVHYRPSLGSAEYGADHLDIMKPEVYTFLDSLFAEYLEGKNPVFVGKRVGIGTDEYSNARQEVVEKFRYFTDRYIRYMHKFGKTAVVWGSLKHAKGTTPVTTENVWMSQWSRDFSDPIAMKKAGYPLISIPDGYTYIVPGAGYYYDYLPEEYLYKNFTPATMDQTLEDGDPAILGGMFAVWNDHPGNGITVKDVHHRLFPALQTLSTKFWNGKNVTFSYAQFDSLRKPLKEAPGINVRGYKYHPKGQSLTLYTNDAPQPNSKTNVEEIGYNYRVEFTVEPQQEERGTILSQSKHATFYLSDPKTGSLSFEREDYIARFRYTLPKNKTVKIAIEGDNKEVRLFENDRLVERLGIQTIYSANPSDKVEPFVKAQPYTLEMYNHRVRMNLHRTLVFPLSQFGNFKSKITGFSASYLNN